jgi:hypothetical protein
MVKYNSKINDFLKSKLIKYITVGAILSSPILESASIYKSLISNYSTEKPELLQKDCTSGLESKLK